MRTKFIALIVLVALATLVVAVGAGCTSNNVEVKMTASTDTGSDRGSDGLTPLERGKVRRQILNQTQEDLDIWLKGDSANYDKAFTKKLLALYRKELVKLSAKGLVKVRRHSKTTMEVTELTGSESTVQYEFTDNSYFVYKGTVKVATPTTNKASMFSIDVVKESGRWKINAMIGNGEATL